MHCCAVRSGKQTCGRMPGDRAFVEKVRPLFVLGLEPPPCEVISPCSHLLQTPDELRNLDVGSRVDRGTSPITSPRRSALARHFSRRPTIPSSSSAHATPIPPAARTSHRALSLPSVSSTFYSVWNGRWDPHTGKRQDIGVISRSGSRGPLWRKTNREVPDLVLVHTPRSLGGRCDGLPGLAHAASIPTPPRTPTPRPPVAHMQERRRACARFCGERRVCLSCVL